MPVVRVVASPSPGRVLVQKSHHSLTKSSFLIENRCFALFSGHQCCKNVELSHILVVKSLFYIVFRTSVLQKRKTVAHFGRETVKNVRACRAFTSTICTTLARNCRLGLGVVCRPSSKVTTEPLLYQNRGKRKGFSCFHV